jgi:acyl carrier protein
MGAGEADDQFEISNRMKTLPTTASNVLEHLACCLPHLELNPSERLGALKIDSIDYVEMLCMIHAEFGVRLNESDLDPSTTLEQLAARVASQATNS